MLSLTSCEKVDLDPVEEDLIECADEVEGETGSIVSLPVLFEVVFCKPVAPGIKIVEEGRLRACSGGCEWLRLAMMMMRRAEMKGAVECFLL